MEQLQHSVEKLLAARNCAWQRKNRQLEHIEPAGSAPLYRGVTELIANGLMPIRAVGAVK